MKVSAQGSHLKTSPEGNLTSQQFHDVVQGTEGMMLGQVLKNHKNACCLEMVDTSKNRTSCEGKW